MTAPSVTYTGVEIGLLAGALIVVLPDLAGNDYEIVDLMIDRALACRGADLGDDIKALVAAARAKGPAK